MKRRLVLVLCLLGVVGGTAGVASASLTSSPQVCVAFVDNNNYNAPKYICVDTP
jgi:hypothetical protein